MEDSNNINIINIRKYNKYVPTLEETDFVGRLINIEPNDISYMFFSNHNINRINYILVEQIKDTTYKQYGKKLKIQPQKKEMLIVIMRHIYFCNITNQYEAEEEVDRLNMLTLYEIIPAIMSELLSKIRYVNDRNTFNIMDLPISANNKRDNLPPLSSWNGF